ncbi:hypothetical protein ABH926_000547 [Catenulispora sp. GP43]|uniref:hypothetical protein n=1 Tax=Catenulispora sp. GP43 TaxID=3156263 RepID=UPI00351771D1
MSLIRSKALAAVALAASLGATAVTSSVAAAPRSASTASTTSAAPTSSALPTSSTVPGIVTLPTGDRVSLDARGHITPLDRGTGTGLTGFGNAAGDRFLIPSEAVPYAGHQLDMSLFDLTKLAALQVDQNSAAARIPVQLTYQPGFTPQAPAGVTLTGLTQTTATGSTATGYLTADSGRALAAALRRQIAADRAAGKPAGASGLPGGLLSMALAGTTAPVTPFYPLHILQIDATDAEGQPANLPVLLVDTDNSQVFAGSATVVDGVARIAVPAGHYAAYATFYEVDSQGYDTKDSLVSIPDFEVPATGTVPTLTIDGRTAASKVAVSTDQPAALDLDMDAVVRTPVTGTPAYVFQVDGPNAPLYVSPAPKAVVGSSEYGVNWNSTAAAYQYVLDYTADHIDANQTYAAHDADLGKGTDTLAGEPEYGTQTRRLSAGPRDSAVGLMIGGVFPNGSTVTTYYTPGSWYRGLVGPSSYTPGQSVDGPVLSSDPVAFPVGKTVPHVWNQGPMAPGVRRHPMADPEDSCGVCSGAGGLNVNLSGAGDSNLDTSGDAMGAETDSYFWNGQPITSNPPAPPWFGLVLASAPAGPATVRAVIDTDRTMAGATQSTKTHTDVSFPYTGKADPAAALPAGNSCTAAQAAGQPTAPCQILPVLTITYQLAGLSVLNTSQLPVQVLNLDIGHESYGDHGPHAAVTEAQASISTDGGTTWRDVPTIGAFGHYVALWPNPAAGTSLTLRVTAKDAVGGTIAQTVTDPYTVG